MSAPILAPKHEGFRVSYSGMLIQTRRCLDGSNLGIGEILCQFQGHLLEMGQQFYAGDIAAVDAFLQCYSIAKDEREAVLAATAAPAQPLTDAARDVLAERRRQVESEGWTPEHDDQYRYGELATAAASYADQARRSAAGIRQNTCPAYWPFAYKFWKPSSQRRDLVKAGALILAEIERLDRAIGQPATKDGGAA